MWLPTRSPDAPRNANRSGRGCKARSFGEYINVARAKWPSSRWDVCRSAACRAVRIPDAMRISEQLQRLGEAEPRGRAQKSLVEGTKSCSGEPRFGKPKTRC